MELNFCDRCGSRVFDPGRLMLRDEAAVERIDLCDSCIKKLHSWLGENNIEDPKKISIRLISDECIVFTDGSKIEYDHDQDCCEVNYADFKQLDDIGKTARFTKPLQFEKTGHGFRFGNYPGNMFFIPCYSKQNGYYSCDVDIIYDGKKVLTVEAEMDD